jgi:2-keto-4-pentenoate hydratase
VSDPRVIRGLQSQLERREQRLKRGEQALGWKIGLNAPAIQEALEIDETVIGNLSDAGLLESGASYSLADGTAVAVEAELAIHLGGGGEIAAYGVAVEIVDIDLPFEDVERIVAENVFHRALMLGASTAPAPTSLVLTVSRNGEVEHSLDASAALGQAEPALAHVRALLAEVGRAPAREEVIITGAIAPLLFVQPGDAVEVRLEPLGSLAVGFSPSPGRS